MTAAPVHGHDSYVPRFFAPLGPPDFHRLKHAASLKGLLKPFKGKGDILHWASDCEALRDGLIALAQRLQGDAAQYPFSARSISLARQTTGAGTAFLRWRNADRSAMGVSLWRQAMQAPTMPASLVQEFYLLELQRIALNMQISLMHTLARQALDCAKKFEEAETVFRRLIESSPSSIPQEVSS
jgi:hypothetical protein